MARNRGVQKSLSFPKGLNTETSKLNPEEGTTSDEINMDLQLNQLIRVRRKGLENQGTDRSTEGVVTGGFYWSSTDLFVVSALSDNPDEELDTVTLYFYESDLTYKTEYTFEVLEDSASTPSFSDIRNRLVITFGTKPFIFKQESSGNLSAFTLDLFVRDFKLADDGLSISQRPVSLAEDHKYNLYNAGWWKDMLIYDESLTDKKDPIEDFNTKIGEYPSNADILFLGNIPNNNGVPTFSASSLDGISIGNTEAPRGHYVYNIRDINRTSKTTNKEADGTPSQTTELVLDDGTNVSGLGGNLLFSDAAPAGDPVDPYVPPVRPNEFEPL